MYSSIAIYILCLRLIISSFILMSLNENLNKRFRGSLKEKKKCMTMVNNTFTSIFPINIFHVNYISTQCASLVLIFNNFSSYMPFALNSSMKMLEMYVIFKISLKCFLFLHAELDTRSVQKKTKTKYLKLLSINNN